MNLLFIDTETGGLEPMEHSLLQIGAVAVKHGVCVGHTNFYISQLEYHITKKAMEINHLDLDQLREKGVTPTVGVLNLISFIEKYFEEKPILVGHNVAFDKDFIQYQLFKPNGYNFNDYISHRMIDTMSLIWGLHLAGKLPIEACSSSGAFDYFGIDINKRHDALDDCYATVKLFEKLIETIE